MLQMRMNSGDDEQILDLVDVPEVVLVQFCDLLLRKQDLRNPDARYMLQEIVRALKAKVEEAPTDPADFYRTDLKAQIAQIEDLLEQL